jgi:hypothetical protein
MDYAEKFYSYGEMPPWGEGPVQDKIHSGRDYIDTEFPLTDSVETCTVQRSSQAAEVQATVADAAQEAEVAAAVAHGGINTEPDEQAQFKQSEKQQDEATGSVRTPISLSSTEQAADSKMRYFRRDDADWSKTALVLACIVLGCMVRKVMQRRTAPPQRE